MLIVGYIKNYPSPKSKKPLKFVVFWKNLPSARHKKTILKRLILNYFWPTNLFGPKLHKNICFETKKYNRTSGIKNSLIFFSIFSKIPDWISTKFDKSQKSWKSGKLIFGKGKLVYKFDAGTKHLAWRYFHL